MREAGAGGNRPKENHGRSARLIEGPKGSGKTNRIISLVRELHAGEGSSCSILVATATPNAARALEARLGVTLGEAGPALSEDGGREGVHRCSGIPSIRVATALELAAEILSSPQAQTRLERTPRLLLPHERRTLEKDLEVLGMKPKRMREMLRFFEHGWADSHTGEVDFLLYDEERELYALLERLLRFEGAMLVAEAPMLALRYARDAKRASLSPQYDHVLVDDMQLMSRASQTLMMSLARCTFTATADPSACSPVFEEYPYADYVEDMTSTFERLERQTLPKRCLASDIIWKEAETPEEEFACIADEVEGAVLSGETPIYIAAPNKTWAQRISAALGERGIAHASEFSTIAGSQERGRNGKTALAYALSLIFLVADPNDSAALRVICGLGDCAASNAGMQALMRLARERDMGADAFTRAMQMASEGATPRALGTHEQRRLNDMLVAFCELRTACHDLSSLNGRDLVAAACARIPAEAKVQQRVEDEILTLCDPENANAPAKVIATALKKNLLFPALTREARCKVVIGPYGGACGLSPAKVVATGAVEGFILAREYFDASSTTQEQQVQQHARWQAAIYQTIGNPSTSCTATSFKRISLEQAEMLGVRIGRIGMKGGMRMARTNRSELLGRELA